MAGSGVVRRAFGYCTERVKEFVGERKFPIARKIRGICQHIGDTRSCARRSPAQIERHDVADQGRRPRASAARMGAAAPVVDRVDFFRVIEASGIDFDLDLIANVSTKVRDGRIGF